MSTRYFRLSPALNICFIPLIYPLQRIYRRYAAIVNPDIDLLRTNSIFMSMRYSVSFIDRDECEGTPILIG
jgi:hypothetical protein